MDENVGGDAVSASGQVVEGSGAAGRVVALLRRLAAAGPRVGFRLVLDGATHDFGVEAPAFTISVVRPDGLAALATGDALTIAEAYLDGSLEIEGDLLRALKYQEVLADRHPWILAWRRLLPLLVGRERVNPGWIATHYDSANAQLFATDHLYDTYTPGIYEADGDTLELGAERKLAAAYAALGLRSGERVLEIGSGWGGMLRYCARRGVEVTGLTLSRDQKAHCDELIAREQLPARVLYQDFFTYEPDRRYDAISMMGVIEDLSDYRRVMRRLVGWLRPGGRVYLDFAAERRRFGTHSFVTRHIWPGTFRMVYMPEFIEAVRESPFELVRVDNDRRNYHLWCRGMLERWQARRPEIEARHGVRLWKTFCLLFAGVSAMMDRPSHSATAYRVVLELPADSDGAFQTRTTTALADAARDALARLRSAALGVHDRVRGRGSP